MAAQKRSLNRNYIDIVEDGSDERRSVVVAPPASIRPIKNYLLDLVAAIRSARGEIS